MKPIADRVILKILSGPTPLDPMQQLGSHLGLNEQSLFVKRDNQLFDGIGGNKARKLEFVLGDLRQKGITDLITYGAWGSNHVLITALCAKKFGFKLQANLCPQPITQEVNNKLHWHQQLGVNVRHHRNSILLALAVLLNKKNPSSIHPGASSPLGSLGYVKAAEELIQQLKEKNLLQKKIKIFLPVGSLGTIAGLLVGLANSEHRAQFEVHGVQVVPIHWNMGKFGILRLCRQISRLLGIPQAPCGKMLKWAPFEYRPGYGAANPEVHQTIDLMSRLEAITLDQTYSGKAMNYLLKYVRSHPPQDHELYLFWNTYPVIN